MEYPVSYAVDENEEATGSVHYFCSEACRASNVLTEPIVDGTSTDVIKGTVCEECGKCLGN